MSGAYEVFAVDETVREEAAIVGAAVGEGDAAAVGEDGEDEEAISASTGSNLSRWAASTGPRHRGTARRRLVVDVAAGEVAGEGAEAGAERGHGGTLASRTDTALRQPRAGFVTSVSKASLAY